MRTIEEIKEILGLKENGCNHCQIARKTGIPRTTVKDICHRYGDLFGLEKVLQTKEKRTKWCRFEPQRDIADNSLYSYLLGMYLGDGCISRATRCEKLRIVLDEKYPCIINETKRAIAGLVTNKVGEVKRKGCVEVFSYSQRWSSFFPQHGKGKKHQRKIELTGWQWGIVENSPQKMLRGLLHSDGCVYDAKSKGYVYRRYSFVNRSKDIIKIFETTCDLLQIRHRRVAYPKIYRVDVSRKKEVAKLEKFIGRKT